MLTTLKSIFKVVFPNYSSVRLFPPPHGSLQFCVYASVYSGECAYRSQRSTYTIFLKCSPTYFFDTASLTEPPGQQTPEILLYLTPQG